MAARTEQRTDSSPAVQRTMRHTVIVKAPAAVVYQLIADVSGWPTVFGPTVHVEVIEGFGRKQRLRIWAFARGAVHCWTSRRHLDPEHLTIDFEQEVSSPPVAAMRGRWTITQDEDGVSTVVLDHDWAAIDDDENHLDLIGKAVDENSLAELGALRAAAELGADRDELTVTFEDSVTIDGPLDKVYDFLYRGQDWPDRLPHVARVALTEDRPGLQHLEMDTRDPDGGVHTTTSVRVCFPDDKIVYKQLSHPGFMSSHVGVWTMTARPDGVLTTSQHTVTFTADAIGRLLGPNATAADARAAIRAALGGNSRITLQQAKSHVERVNGGKS